MAGKGKIGKFLEGKAHGALGELTDVLSFSDAKQKRDFSALPEDVKYQSAHSLQQPLITKDRNIHELASEIASRGVGRSESGVTINTPSEKELMGLILEQMESMSALGKSIREKGHDHPETIAIINRTNELYKIINDFGDALGE